jgi:hypothetical protein
MGNQNKQTPTNRPAWINKLCEALTEALKDDRLPEPIFEALSSVVDVATNDHLQHVSDHARLLLPDALECAIQSAEDEDTGHDDFKPFLKQVAEDKPELFRFFIAALLPDQGDLSTDDAISQLSENLDDEGFRQRTEQAIAALKKAMGLTASPERTTAKTHKVIRAKRFELVDEKGKLRAFLETCEHGTQTRLVLRGKNHNSIQLIADELTGQTALIVLDSAKDCTAVRLGLPMSTDDSEFAALEIGDSIQHNEAYLRRSINTQDDAPTIELFDRKGDLRALLALAEDGAPQLSLYNSEGKEITD